MGNEASIISGVAKAKGGANKFLDDLTATNDKNRPQPVTNREMNKRRKERELEFMKRKQEREERKSMLQEKWSGKPKTTTDQMRDVWNKTKYQASTAALNVSEKAEEVMERFNEDEKDDEGEVDTSWAEKPASPQGGEGVSKSSSGPSTRDRLAQLNASKGQKSSRKDRRSSQKAASPAAAAPAKAPAAKKDDDENAWWKE